MVESAGAKGVLRLVNCMFRGLVGKGAELKSTTRLHGSVTVTVLQMCITQGAAPGVKYLFTVKHTVYVP